MLFFILTSQDIWQWNEMKRSRKKTSPAWFFYVYFMTMNDQNRAHQNEVCATHVLTRINFQPYKYYLFYPSSIYYRWYFLNNSAFPVTKYAQQLKEKVYNVQVQVDSSQNILFWRQLLHHHLKRVIFQTWSKFTNICFQWHELHTSTMNIPHFINFLQPTQTLQHGISYI